MEVRKGYKLTEYGIIPEEWDCKKVQTLIDINAILSHLDGNHGALYPRSNEFKESGVPYIAANDFISGKVSFENCKYLSEERALKFQKGIAKDGDVLFAHNATVGPVALLRTTYDYVILSTTATYYRCDNKRLLNNYLQYALRSAFFVKQYTAVMAQSTRFQVPITAQRKFYLAIPPTIEEQTVIANALIDADALIKSLEQLIAKKRNIKQGAMQQLLQPKEGWEVKKLGDIASIYQPKTISKEHFTDDGYLVYGANGIVGYYSQFNHEKWQVTITCRGSTCGTVNKTVDKCWITGNAMVMNIDSNLNVDKQFFYYLLSKQDFTNCITGSGQPQIVREPLREFKVALPANIEEQKDISEVISNMDNEIFSLETKLEKFKLIKQGMMQQLLTGKIRLV